MADDTVLRSNGSDPITQKAVDLGDGTFALATTSPEGVDSAITSLALYNVAIVAGSTEYSQALPATCRRFAVRSRGGNAIYLAFETGKVAGPTAPYLTVPANHIFDSGIINVSDATVYLAGTAGDVVEIEAWG